MKILETTILLFLSFPLLSQTSDYSGTYELKIDPINDGTQTWTLHLNPNA